MKAFILGFICGLAFTIAAASSGMLTAVVLHYQEWEHYEEEEQIYQFEADGCTGIGVHPSCKQL
jgi:hypothetical protein